MKVKQKIKNLFVSIYNIRLGDALGALFIAYLIYRALRLVYIELRYNLSEVVWNIIWWIVFILSALLLKWILDRLEKKNKKDTDI